MAGAPLGWGSGSAAAIGKAEPGAWGHCPRRCRKSHSCSSSRSRPAAGRVRAAHERVLGSCVCVGTLLCVCVRCSSCAGSAVASSIVCWAQPVTAAHAGHPGCVLWVICESSLHPCLPVPTLPVPTLPVPTLPVPTLPMPTLPVPTLPVPMLPVPTLPVPTLPVPTLPVLAAQRSTGDISLRVQSSQLPPAPGVRGKGVTLLP